MVNLHNAGALALVALAWSLPSAAAAQTLPQPTGSVSDYANVLDDPSEQRLETMLDALERRRPPKWPSPR
jgi:uncharacterized membrane protein YgcG